MRTPIPTVLACAAALLAGCSDLDLPPAAADLATAHALLGEPDELGHPSIEEREMLVLTNQVRAAANNQCGDWTEQFGPDPLPPLIWSAPGGHGARFTAQHLHDGKCFQHQSCCVLEKKTDGTVGCAGDWIAPCGLSCSEGECTGGTDTAERYHLFDFGSYSGENLAAGQALASSTICQWLHSDGHRANIYSSHTELGTGYHKGAACYRHYWVQGFGRGDRPIPRIAAASAIRTAERPGDASAVYFAANYYDMETEEPPLRASVVVGGNCKELQPMWGLPHSGTWEYHPPADDFPEGCHRYYFLFVDADANRYVYPSTGTFGLAIGVDRETCPDYDPGEQPPASCEGGPAQCEEGDRMPCYDGEPGTENVGQCRSGARLCRNGFWTLCRGQVTPREELCNGLDDDCDGEVDEGIPAEGTACTLSATVNQGLCSEGVRSCIAGKMVCLSTVEPREEVCNGLDDDCDGVIDDGFGQIACGVGACRVVVDACSGGQEQTCEPLPAGREVCTERGPTAVAIDEDCDGEYDEGCSCEDGEILPCYSGPASEVQGGRSACRAGIMRCDGGSWGPCQGEVRPSAEICDGIDNDCDGKTDEAEDLGSQVCGTGRCRNKPPVCLGARENLCQELEPSEEICNGLDDDCDGEIDEGCECQEGASSFCFDGDPFQLGVGVCQAGERFCVDGAWDAVCEGQVLPSPEICNGLDDDCDGEIDEDCIDPGAGGAGGGGGAGGSVEVPGTGGTQDGKPDPGDVDEGGCGCSGGGPGASGLALALAGLALLRRRPARP